MGISGGYRMDKHFLSRFMWSTVSDPITKARIQERETFVSMDVDARRNYGFSIYDLFERPAIDNKLRVEYLTGGTNYIFREEE